MPRPIVPQALCVPCCRGHPPVAIPMPVCERLTVNKMPKSRRSRTTQRGITHDEIQALLSKLKEIVPNMPRNRKLSKLEIIQYVIDYIVDLQIALESHPGSNRGVNSTLRNPRQPLGVISSPSNSSNTCLSNEVSPKLLPEVSSHSVSC